jgi:hypothetical protein
VSDPIVSSFVAIRIPMPRMIDTIRASALPSNMMQFAAKGALMVPPQEMIEILVYLAKHNKVFGSQARMTLASWDEKSSLIAAGNPASPKEVLDYLTDQDNLRPVLLPALLENPSVKEDFLIRLATYATREQVDIILGSPRACKVQRVLEILAASKNLTTAAAMRVKEAQAALAGHAVSGEQATPVQASELTASVHADVAAAPPETHAVSEAQGSSAPGTPVDDEAEVPDDAVHAFMAEHSAEISAAAQKEFDPVEEEQPAEANAAQPVATADSSAAAAAVKRAPQKKWILNSEEQRGSALQKISKLDIKGRIQLAMKGTKEERSLLIRDGTKIVALAVLESPKLTDAEVEKFATQKNVLEAVLRAIPMKRRFMKQYPIVRNLTFNPRTPIDVSLGLIKNLLTQDLRHLSGNKEVSETVRKLALKMFRQKLDVTKKS